MREIINQFGSFVYSAFRSAKRHTFHGKITPGMWKTLEEDLSFFFRCCCCSCSCWKRGGSSNSRERKLCSLWIKLRKRRLRKLLSSRLFPAAAAAAGSRVSFVLNLSHELCSSPLLLLHLLLPHPPPSGVISNFLKNK